MTDQEIIVTLQGIIDTAQQEMEGSTDRAVLSNGRDLIAALQASIAKLQATPASGIAPRTVVVTSADPSLYSIAQRELGDPLRYRDIMELNGMAFIALSVGQRLLVPGA